ncbi:hypothetical protein PE067_18285 [Paracoccus sp. DMF-8]|uniref:hypothetical protein n=1 Tax=Paracoccus sp. DMF-8 TaxID=3019445 RepID=UPI0023E39AD8|nr:hypothetical protein [Paracoccus sp. DMF-8]MDF3607915.1 hypothetical protein [Paracoccus sp. DMF-8]
MGKRGNRPVVMRAADAVVAARWLRGTAIPALRDMPGTILGGDYSETVERLDRLARVLSNAGKRKRAANEFSALIEIEDAAAFARAISVCRPAWPLRHSPAIMRLADAMRDGGARKRRGRKSLTAVQIGARVSGRLAVDERHRKRLAAQARHSAALDHWYAELRAHGRTILTADLPPPKI